jgi:hypothetical protein
LAGCSVLVLAGAALVWLETRHLVPRSCGQVYAHSRWAPALAVAAVVVAIGGLVTVLADWVAASTGSRPPMPRAQRRLATVVATVVLLGAVLCLGGMYADTTVTVMGCR